MYTTDIHTILLICRCMFRGRKGIHTVVQPSSPPSPELCHLPKWKLGPHWTRHPVPSPLPWPLAATILLSLSTNLTVLGTSRSVESDRFVLLWMVSFTKYNILKAHPCCRLKMSFLLKAEWYSIVWTDQNLFIDPFNCRWILDHFQLLARVNNAAGNVGAHPSA